MNGRVVTRYPLPVRSGAVLVCVIFAAAIARGPAVTGTIIVAVVAVCFCIAILAYKAEVEPTEVRVRYLPFYTKSMPMRDITHLSEEKTLVLVTATSKIPLWGLSLKAREALFEILPRHLDVLPAYPSKRNDSAAVVRRHVRRTILVAVGFIVSLGLSVPFLKGNPWNMYVETVGEYVLFFCLCMFLLFLFQAGFTYVLWSSKRAFDKIESREETL